MWVEAITRVNYPTKDILLSLASANKIDMSKEGTHVFRGLHVEFPIMD